MNTTKLLDSYNPMLAGYQLTNINGKDLLINNPLALNQSDISTHPTSITGLQEGLPFNNQPSNINLNHYLKLNNTSQQPTSELYFHTTKPQNVLSEAQKTLTASPISNSPQTTGDSRVQINNALISHETSPSLPKQQNHLDDLTKARLNSQNSPNYQLNSHNAIYSQYVMSQAQKSPNTSVASTPNVQINKSNEIHTPASPLPQHHHNIQNSTPTKSVDAPDTSDDFKASPARIAKQRASEKKAQAQKDLLSEPNLYDLVKSNSRNSVDHSHIKEHSNMLLEDDDLSEERDSLTGTPQKTNKTDLAKKKIRQCYNQFCITDPTDATKWCRQKVRNSNICKQCFDAFKKQQYCYYCSQIYDENSSYSDGKEWIGCEECNHWHHIDCEAANDIPDIQELSKQDSFKYTCPFCRNPPVEQKPNPVKQRGPYKKLEFQDQSLRKELLFDPTMEVRPAVHDHPSDENSNEEIITKKLRINSEPTDEGYAVLPVVRESFQAPTEKDLIKKKLDSTINRTFLNKKKFVIKPLLNLSEFSNEIERLMTQYGGKRVQLSESEIRSDLTIFRELSGSTCPTDEKSSHSGDRNLEKINEMWDEQSRSDYNEEERYPKRNITNSRNLNQLKPVRSNKSGDTSQDLDYTFEVREKTRGTRGRKRGKGRGRFKRGL